MSEYAISETEYQERYDLEPLECSESCSHFDSLNQCCWVVPKHGGLCTDAYEGDLCKYGIYVDENGNHVHVVWNEKTSINNGGVRTEETP